MVRQLGITALQDDIGAGLLTLAYQDLAYQESQLADP